jgi:L-ascorbate metabolism protein UlaG (beta-lactamase superfamily)
MRPRLLWVIAGTLIAAVAYAMNAYYDPAKPHHTRDGFRNNYPQPPRASFLKWQWERWEQGLPKTPEGGWHFPVDQPDIAFLRSNRSEFTATWIGHATVLLQIGGVNILTDPMFGERASPVSFAGPKRVVPPTPDLEQLPHIDIVLISHNHYDHLDVGSVERLARQQGGPPRFYVPLGLKPWFANLGIVADEMDWWDARNDSGLVVHFVPSQHWSARTLLDRDETLWGGFVVEHPRFRLMYTGDTGYSRDFADIQRRFASFDLALIPIGAYEPRWFMAPQHIDPDEAVRIHQELHARQSLGVHWGTFVLTDEPLDEPPRRLARALREANLAPDAFWALHVGETRRLIPH